MSWLLWIVLWWIYCCLGTKSCLILLWPHGLQPTRLLCPWDFPGKKTGVGCHFLLQIISLFYWKEVMKMQSILFIMYLICCCSVAQSCPTPCCPMDCSTPGCCPLLLSPRVCSDSCPLSWWYHATISSSVSLFSCPQSFPASGSFPVSQFLGSGGQSIGVSAPASVLPMNIQGWFPLGLTGLMSLLSKGLSRVFSNTTVGKHHFFGTQPSLWSTITSVHDYWKNLNLDYMDLFHQSDVSAF